MSVSSSSGPLEDPTAQEAIVPTPYHPQEPQAVTARRYRTSDYFLDDMLRCSEAVNDFRSIRSMVNQMGAFSLHQSFRFATEHVTVPSTKPPHRA